MMVVQNRQFIDIPNSGKPETKEEYDIRPFAH